MDARECKYVWVVECSNVSILGNGERKVNTTISNIYSSLNLANNEVEWCKLCAVNNDGVCIKNEDYRDGVYHHYEYALPSNNLWVIKIKKRLIDIAISTSLI